MSQPLRLLIVEDSEDDAFLMLHTLRQGGYAVTAEVVQTEPTMRAALENQKWDIITSDHSMPRFNARDSLALAKRLCPDVPFIIVSGEIDLNLAVSLMRGGAEDYIQKRELARLVPAIERELRELALHRERQQVDRALIKSDERLREVLENSLDVAYKRNIQTQSYDYLSPVTARVTGYTPDELMSLPQETLLSWIHPDDLGEYTRLVIEGVSRAAGTEAQVEFRFKHKDGHYLWLRDSFIVIPDAHGKPLSRIGSISDVTERKRLDEALKNRLVALTRPLDQPEIIDFKDLFDLETIQRLQDEFAAATQVASIITQPDGTPITRPSNFCRLCEQIIRQTAQGHINCFKSDAEIGRYNPEGPLIQPCMSGGLWDAGAGISVGGRHIANWLIGQVRDETQTEEKMRAYARAIGADESAVSEAFHEVPAMSKDQFQRVARALFTMASQLSNMAYLNIQQARFITESKQAEEALRTSEANFREIFNSTNEAIFIDDAETGQMLDVNDPMLKLYGYESKVEVLAGSIGALSANEPSFTEDQAQEFIRKAVQEGPQVFDWLAKRRDGSKFWTEVSLCKSQIGGKGRVLAVVRDINARKRSDAERDALLEIMQGLAVTKDLQEILSFVHHSVAKVIYAENFFVVFYNKGTGLFEEVYSVDQYDPPAPPSRLEKSITAYTFRTGKPIIMTQALFNQLEAQGEVEMVGTNSASWLGAPLITPDGTIGVIAIQDYATADRYTENDKKFLAYVGSQVALAIERKRAEEALRESEDIFKYVFDHSVSGKSITLPSGEINVNQAGCEMIGYSPEELAQRKWQEITHPDDLELTQNAANLLLSGEKETVRFIKRYIHKNGSVVWVDFGSALRRDKDGNPLYFVTSLNDITRRMQAEDEIRQLNAELEQRVAERTAQLTAANQEMEAFSFSVSHDLRAPLRRLAGFSMILLQDYAGQLDEQGQHYLTRIQESSFRMEQLINDLLKLSRVTRADFSRQPVDLSSLAQRISAELQVQSPQRRVGFDITANMLVQGDENLLKILLENLLDNAYKFTSRREQAAIQVSVLEQEGRPVYFVRDNGAGFDMASADRLFSPFQRLHSEKEFPGTGIGLATVKRIIHRHGGRVWAESVVDKGAAFYFTLD